MGIINRFLLFFYTLFFALLSLSVIVLCTGILPIEEVWNNVLYALGRMETVGAAVVIFLISIELMGNCFSSSKDKNLGSEGIIAHGEHGDVKITKNAILDLANKLCCNVPGVREAKIRIKFTKKNSQNDLTTYLRIKLIIGQEYNAVEISDKIQKDIKDQLSLYMGLDDVSLDITVDNISNAVDKKKRVI